MTADNLKFGKHGMQDTAFEAPRKVIAPERAEQQCNCYYCAFDCKFDCTGGGGMGAFYSTNNRISYDESEMTW